MADEVSANNQVQTRQVELHEYVSYCVKEEFKAYESLLKNQIDSLKAMISNPQQGPLNSVTTHTAPNMSSQSSGEVCAPNRQQGTVVDNVPVPAGPEVTIPPLPRQSGKRRIAPGKLPSPKKPEVS